MADKNLRRVSVLVTAQTAYNLERLAYMAGYGKKTGRVIDKLVREKMIALSGHSGSGEEDKNHKEKGKQYGKRNADFQK